MRIRRLIGTLAVAATLAGLSVPTAAGAAPTRPTLVELQALLASSVGVNAPNLLTTVPAQSVVGKTDYGKIPTVCFNPSFAYQLPPNTQSRCALGDLRSARKILVFGDNVALQWVPALTQLGIDLHWRVIFIGKPQCSAWNYRSVAGTAACRHFIHSVVAFANALHARYVMPMGAKVAWRGTKNASVKQLRYEIGATLDGLKPSRSRILLMESIPQFNHGYTDWTPSQCFVKFYNNMDVCERVLRNFAVTSTTSLAIWRLSIARHLHIVPTMPLFCSGIKCALFVKSPSGTYLVYRDSTRMSRYYSNFIARALEDEMRPLLS